MEREEAKQSETPQADHVAPAFNPALPPREKHPFRLILTVVLLTGVVLAFIYNRSTKRRGELLRTQQACLTYSLPADTVVYAADVSHATPLWPAIWKWARPDEPSPPAGATLFFHERQTVLGKRGLICVQADPAERRLRVTFIHPGSTRLDAVAVTEVAVVPRPQEGIVLLTPAGDPFESKLPPIGESPTPQTALRLFAGQPDAKDPTQFSIRYEWAGQNGLITMWVQDERTVYYVDRRLAL